MQPAPRRDAPVIYGALPNTGRARGITDRSQPSMAISCTAMSQQKLAVLAQTPKTVSRHRHARYRANMEHMLRERKAGDYKMAENAKKKGWPWTGVQARDLRASSD